jgi:hypothetical protein
MCIVKEKSLFSQKERSKERLVIATFSFTAFSGLTFCCRCLRFLLLSTSA